MVKTLGLKCQIACQVALKTITANIKDDKEPTVNTAGILFI